MHKSVRFMLMSLSFVALIVCSVVLPFAAQASTTKERVIAAEWGATSEKDWNALEAALSDLKPKRFTGADAQLHDGVLISDRFGEKASADQVAAWVHQQYGQQLRAAGCVTITVRGRIWIPAVLDWVIVEFDVRVCPD